MDNILGVGSDNYILLHRPIFSLDEEFGQFKLHMPLQGKAGEVEYNCFYDSKLMLFCRKRNILTEAMDLEVFFVAKRQEYRFDPKKEYTIKEEVFNRKPIRIRFTEHPTLSDEIGGLTDNNHPYFPYSPFAYYSGLFEKSGSDAQVCSLCGEMTDLFMKCRAIKTDARGRQISEEEITVCPTCISKGKITGINEYEADKGKKIRLISDATPHVICKTSKVCDEYRDINPDSGYYSQESWPVYDYNNPYIVPVFIGYLRKDNDDDSSVFEILDGRRDDICNNISPEMMEILGLDEFDDEARALKEDFADTVNRADIRMFAFFDSCVRATSIQPSAESKCYGYAIDVPFRGYTD